MAMDYAQEAKAMAEREYFKQQQEWDKSPAGHVGEARVPRPAHDKLRDIINEREQVLLAQIAKLHTAKEKISTLDQRGAETLVAILEAQQ